MGSYGEGNGVFSGAPNAITYKVPWNSAEGEAGFGGIEAGRRERLDERLTRND